MRGKSREMGIHQQQLIPNYVLLGNHSTIPQNVNFPPTMIFYMSQNNVCLNPG